MSVTPLNVPYEPQVAELTERLCDVLGATPTEIVLAALADIVGMDIQGAAESERERLFNDFNTRAWKVATTVYAKRATPKPDNVKRFLAEADLLRNEPSPRPNP